MQQKRSKTRSDDDHPGIPRDANGDPIFLILPSALRARYEKEMALCEGAWRAGEVCAVSEAVELSRCYRQPIPDWLGEAVVRTIAKLRTKAQARRYREAQARMTRYMTVRDLKVGIPGIYEPTAGHLSWLDAYAEASRILEGTYAKGDTDTMKSDYAKVKRDLKATRVLEGTSVKRDLKAKRTGKYFVLRDWRHRFNGKADPSGPNKPLENT
jgi:hypothetical protein